MFFLRLHYQKTLEEVNANLAAHRIYLDKYYQLHKFICSGPQEPRTGGCILRQAQSLEEVQSIIQEDPFYIQKVAEYEIIQFHPTKYATDFEPFILPQ